MTEKKRTGAEIIAFHLGWDMPDVTAGRYQHYNPAVYVCGDDYFCCPALGKFPPKFGYNWEKIGEHYGRSVYTAKAEEGNMAG